MSINFSTVKGIVSSPLASTGHRFGMIHIYTTPQKVKKLGKNINNFADISCRVEKSATKAIWTVICTVIDHKDHLGWEKNNQSNNRRLIMTGKKIIVSYETPHSSDKILNIVEKVF